MRSRSALPDEARIDQKNWEPNAPLYGNDSILRLNPISVELTAKVKF
jgi:hypothetical protein